MEEPFKRWGLDFIGEIHLPSGQHKQILTAIDYYTKWVESILTHIATDSMVIKFLEENYFARFGCSKKIVTDNDEAFKSAKLIDFFPEEQHHIGSLYHLLSTGKWVDKVVKQDFGENFKENYYGE